MDDRTEREILARLDYIERYRQRTGADLKQAKAAVEQAARGY
jgi:ribosomal protein L7/L12